MLTISLIFTGELSAIANPYLNLASTQCLRATSRIAVPTPRRRCPAATVIRLIMATEAGGSLMSGSALMSTASVANSVFLVGCRDLTKLGESRSRSSSVEKPIRQAQFYVYALCSRSYEKKNSTTHFLSEGHLDCHMPKAHIATLIG